MLEGRCLCGDVRYELTAEPLWVAYCHCATCRRHVASPVALFIGMRDTQVRWSGAGPARYASSPGVERCFCPNCGTPVSYASTRFPGEVHLYHGTLENPAAAPPRGHVHVAGQLPWFEIEDALPRYERTGEGGAKPVRIGRRKAG